jgi:hypothetical protein
MDNLPVLWWARNRWSKKRIELTSKVPYDSETPIEKHPSTLT